MLYASNFIMVNQGSVVRIGTVQRNQVPDQSVKLQNRVFLGHFVTKTQVRLLRRADAIALADALNLDDGLGHGVKVEGRELRVEGQGNGSRELRAESRGAGVRGRGYHERHGLHENI